MTNRRTKKFRPCFDRNSRLRELGYRSYREYINSDDWKSISREKLAETPNCQRCGKKANQVHHTDYSFEVILGIDRTKLVSLCGACHRAIEFDTSGPKAGKRGLYSANSALESTSNVIIFPNKSFELAYKMGLLRKTTSQNRNKRKARKYGLRPFYVLSLSVQITANTVWSMFKKLTDAQRQELDDLVSRPTLANRP